MITGKAHVTLSAVPRCVPVQTFSPRFHLQLLVKSTEMCLMRVQCVRVSICNVCVHVIHICILYVALLLMHFSQIHLSEC